MGKTLLLAIVMMLGGNAGCGFARYFFPEAYERASYWEENPDNPFEQIKTVAIVPFVNFTNNELETLSMAQSMESELSKFRGFQVIPARQVEQIRRENRITLNSAANVRRLGRILRTDAVIVCAIFEYDPYRNPRYGVTLQLYPTSLLDDQYVDVENLSRSGLPFQVPESVVEKPLIGFSRLFDANSRQLRGRLMGYADARLGEVEPMGYQKFLTVMPEYTRFCHNELLREMCERETGRQKLKAQIIEEKRGAGKHDS